VSSASVDTDYFEVLGVPILAGRGFHGGDLEPGARPIIVNQSFVDLVLGWHNPIGRRVRYTLFDERGPLPQGDQPWHEIAGLVRDLGLSYGSHDPKKAGIYHPMAPGGTAFGPHGSARERAGRLVRAATP
jgi:hypothetical protein